jgi:hypothetical protein
MTADYHDRHSRSTIPDPPTDNEAAGIARSLQIGLEGIRQARAALHLVRISDGTVAAHKALDACQKALERALADQQGQH